MHRNDANIEDAVFDVVEESSERPKQLHPQLALWLARVFLCALVVAGALIMRPHSAVRPVAETPVASNPTGSDPGTSSATSNSAFAGFEATRSGGAEPLAIPASLPAAPLLRPLPTTPRAAIGSPDAPEAEDLVVEKIRTRKARSSADIAARFHRPHRRTAQNARAAPRPLTFIARGAKRTVRTVRSVISRLF